MGIIRAIAARTPSSIEVSHPTEFDFYPSRTEVCSGLVVRRVICTETLQSLSFALCHISARSPQSVSIPAHVYCARQELDVQMQLPAIGYQKGIGQSESTQRKQPIPQMVTPVDIAE
ncbi:hypothetical protein DFH07DRAFT_960443 [Mycena maculata]|uniref:Uncharacterized protein n=1 Tax=Mycena maculata TaxID=230809 RepID=A0AAD7IY38_9AGAR|nr:hypothetical protein DFH07DRAFT_960443 [Mycena maculata]